MPNLILYAVPFFFLLIAIELFVDHRLKSGTITWLTRSPVSRWEHSVKSPVCSALIFIGLYAFVRWSALRCSISARRTRGSGSAPSSPTIFLLLESSPVLAMRSTCLGCARGAPFERDYNLTNGVAATSSGILCLAGFSMFPDGFAGVPLPVFVTVAAALNLLYQYWIHTPAHRQALAGSTVGFASPSNHRVHHGRTTIASTATTAACS